MYCRSDLQMVYIVSCNLRFFFTKKLSEKICYYIYRAENAIVYVNKSNKLRLKLCQAQV